MPSTLALIVTVTVVVLAWVAPSPAGSSRQSDAPDGRALALWKQGKVAFGVFVPDENPAPRGPGRTPVYSREGASKLAANPLYDFVFLNLEGGYDASAVRTVADGLKHGTPPRPTLLVRIPSIERDGAETTKARVRDALELGADGVTIPHVRSVEEARVAIGFFADAGANVWSPSNPHGRTVAMLMLEDPGAVAQARAIAGLPGYSVLACGIGSLTAALGGNRAEAEAGNQTILAETTRATRVNMLTATTQDIAQRVEQGFLALIAMGPDADAAIARGRAAAGR